MPSKKVYSSLCCTFFTSLFFAGLEGKDLSNSSKTGVFEVNVKFCNNLTEPMKKKKWRQNVASATLYFIPYIEKP